MKSARHALRLLSVLAVFGSIPAVAQQAVEKAEPELRGFQLVFLVPNEDFEPEQGIDEALVRHRFDRAGTAGALYLRNLIKDDVALIAGPLPDHERIQQVIVIDRETREEVESVFEHNPSITTGLMELEIYTWWAPPGVLRKPKDTEVVRTAYLGMLRRPEKPTDYPAAKLEELQAHHLEHIRRMTESGDLVIAGPVEDRDLRGILIFHTREPDRIRELVAQDPLVQAGRLEFELYRWLVPRGSWPRPEQSTETPDQPNAG